MTGNKASSVTFNLMLYECVRKSIRRNAFFVENSDTVEHCGAPISNTATVFYVRTIIALQHIRMSAHESHM